MSWRAIQAASLLSGAFGLLVIPVALWPRPHSFVAFAGSTLYCVLALALATEMTELILALIWDLPPLPRAIVLPPRWEAAVVMTVCDDWSEHHLSHLAPFVTAGHDVFLLDDSVTPARIPAQLAGKIVHVRRSTRAGAKAGNLNHWLRLHSHRYSQLILLDADSTMSVETTDALLLSAEHPDNADVAIFQAKIESAPPRGSLLATLLSVGARPRARVMERVHMPLGLLLSFGHNQLLRLAALGSVGGFDETLTNEDTAGSLHLASRGWRIAIVDAWSCDEEPATVNAYLRRTLRWAMQTLEVFRQDWSEAPLRLKLLLCRHLLMHTVPIASMSLLLVSLWTGPPHPRESLALLIALLRLAPGYAFYGVTVWLLLAMSGFFAALRVSLARLEGVSWRDLTLSALLGTAFLPLLVLPLAVAMVRMLLGAQVRFVPTNSRLASVNDASFKRQFFQAVSLLLVLVLLVAGAIRRPGSLLLGTNWLWCGLLLLSPISLLILTRVRSRQQHPQEGNTL